MKSAVSIASIVILVLGVLPGAARAQDAVSLSDRPTVAVLDFDLTAAQERAVPGQRAPRGRPTPPNIEAINVGKGIADLMVAELVNSGDVRVLERQRMAEVAREQPGNATLKA